MLSEISNCLTHTNWVILLGKSFKNERPFAHKNGTTPPPHPFLYPYILYYMEYWPTNLPINLSLTCRKTIQPHGASGCRYLPPLLLPPRESSTLPQHHHHHHRHPPLEADPRQWCAWRTRKRFFLRRKVLTNAVQNHQEFQLPKIAGTKLNRLNLNFQAILGVGFPLRKPYPFGFHTSNLGTERNDWWKNAVRRQQGRRYISSLIRTVSSPLKFFRSQGLQDMFSNSGLNNIFSGAFAVEFQGA